MKLVLSEGDLAQAPIQYARVRFIESKERRIIREQGVEWLTIGVEEGKSISRRKFIRLCRAVIAIAKQNNVRHIALAVTELAAFKNVRTEELGKLIAENFEMANFEYTAFKTPPKDGFDFVEEVLLCGAIPHGFSRGLQIGQEIGKAVNACRTLANTPGGHMTPRLLAAAARATTRGSGVSPDLKVTVLGEKEMKKLGMGALLGVAKGSTEKPAFIMLEYCPSTVTYRKRPIVLVGKGVTFDSGGLNLKSSSSIYEMHMDMSGAAAVLYTVALAARLKLKKHVVALIPAVENMPGNSAYRPGDVLTSLSGKTIEVLDTDAEGRLILADALTYAKRLTPSVVIDVATLTGAVLSALGLHASGLLTRNDALAEKLLASGEESGDYLWRLPLWDEYEDRVKGTFADLKNVPGGPTSRYGGAIDGAMFLWQFAKELDCPWAHLDIASRMTAAPGDELSEGAAGAPVRALIHFIDTWKP